MSDSTILNNNLLDSDCVDPDAARTSDDIKLSSILNSDLQKQLVAHVIHCPEVAQVAVTSLDPQHFESEAARIITKLALSYFAKYGKLIPTPLLEGEFKAEIRKKDKGRQVAMLGELREQTEYMTFESPQYWCDKIIELGESIAIRKALKEYVSNLSAAKLYDALAKAREQSKTTEPFTLKSPKKLQTLDAIEWRIADHFPSNGTVCVFGPSGVCKTFFMLDMALSVACGIPFLGRHETIQGKVLYINSEGAYNLKSRQDAWLLGHGKTIDDIDPHVLFSTVCHNLQDRSEIDRLIKMALDQMGSVDVIVVDTLSRNFGQGDTDKNSDMQNYLRGVDYMREKTGAAVVNVHHTGWGDVDRERGAKSLRDYCDASIGITKKDDTEITVSCKKQKDAPEFSDYTLLKQAESGSLWLRYVDRTEAEAEEHATATSQLLTFVPNLPLGTEPTEQNTVTVQMLESTAKSLNLSERKFRGLLNDLINDGVIQRQRLVSRGVFRYFQVSDISA